ncbi:MAG: hypothetical protein DWP95_10140 [Proteobacteria bacterium]|nr:MAG: hypothetical protein DWP95_10140 [Pseudomonadota bacterium]
MTKPILTSLYAYGHNIGKRNPQHFKGTEQTYEPKQQNRTHRRLQKSVNTYIRVVYKSESQRQIIEQFIQCQYKKHFNAQIHHFFPVLISVYQQSNDELIAVVGVRYADQGTLFAEQYLSKPVEQSLAQHAGQIVPRTAVIELGHFAIINRRYLALVVRAIANFISQLEVEWLVYSVSQPMVKAMHRLHIPSRFMDFARAEKWVDRDNPCEQYDPLKPAVYCFQIATVIQAINNTKGVYDCC